MSQSRRTAPQIDWKTPNELLPPTFPQWLIKDIIPAKSTVCLFGRRGLGKTFLALDFALSLACGWPWLGTFDVTRGKVAYLLAENPDGLGRRLEGWLHHKAKQGYSRNEGLRLIQENLIVASAAHGLDDAQDFKALSAALKPRAPLGLIVLDPLVSFMRGSENDTRDMQELVLGMRNLVEQFACSLLVVHHEGKNAFKGARGSSALEAGLDTVLNLNGIDADSGKISLEITKQREEKALPKMNLQLEQVSGEFGGVTHSLGMFATGAEQTVKPEDPRVVRKQQRHDNIRRIAAQLCADSAERAFDVLSLIDAVQKAGGDKNNSDNTIREDLKALVDAGLFGTRKAGQKKLYFPIEKDDE